MNNKRQNTENKKRINIFPFAVIGVLIIAALIIFKNYDKIEFKKSEPKVQTKRENNIYNSYKVTSEKVSSDLYYVKVTNVICDALPDRYNKKHYFNMGYTIEAHSKKDAEAVKQAVDASIAEVRRITQNYSTNNIDRPAAMTQLKSVVKSKINNASGKPVAQEVYFSSFLNQ